MGDCQKHLLLFQSKGVALKPPIHNIQLGPDVLSILQLLCVAERVSLNVSFVPKLQHGGTHCRRTCLMILELSQAICFST